MLNLGTVKPGATIRIPFSTFDKDDGSSITMTGYAAADILVYKDGSTSERASTAGFTATTDFDGKAGKHLSVIDLADDTTADFWKAGSEYLVGIDAVTVDGVTTGGWLARFQIGYPGANLDTFIAALTSQTVFTLSAGPAEDDALNGHWLIIHDKASAVQRATGLILDYTGATKSVTLAAAPTFAITAGDNIAVMDLAPLQPAVIGRTLAVDGAGLGDANVVKAAGTAWNGGAIGAATFAANAINAAKLDPDVATELQSGLATTAGLGLVYDRIGAPHAASIAADVEVLRLYSSGFDAILNKLDSALEADGGGGYRLTHDALLQVAQVMFDVNSGTYHGAAVAGSVVSELLAGGDARIPLAMFNTGGGDQSLAVAGSPVYEILFGTSLQINSLNTVLGRLNLMLEQDSDGNWLFTGLALSNAPAGGGATVTEIADAVLTRDWTLVSGEASRSALNALRWIRNGFYIDSDGVAHIVKEDDSTTAYTRALATDPLAQPIVGVGAGP